MSGSSIFVVHIPLKTPAFQQARSDFDINPARSYACGDEKQDFVAAASSGMHPFMVSYGFEDFARLTGKIGVPAELVSRTPTELCAKVCHGLDIDTPRQHHVAAAQEHRPDQTTRVAII